MGKHDVTAEKHEKGAGVLRALRPGGEPRFLCGTMAGDQPRPGVVAQDDDNDEVVVVAPRSNALNSAHGSSADCAVTCLMIVPACRMTRLLASCRDMLRFTQVLVLLRRGLPLFVIAGVVWWSTRGWTPNGALGDGSTPPQLSLTLSDGTHFSIADSPQVVVLNFWASYCPPCRAEAPVLSAFQAQTADAKVVGLSVESESADEAASQAKRLGMRYAVGVADQALQSRFRVQSIPTTYVVAKSGKIVWSHVGPINSRELTSAVASARDAS